MKIIFVSVIILACKKSFQDIVLLISQKLQHVSN